MLYHNYIAQYIMQVQEADFDVITCLSRACNSYRYIITRMQQAGVSKHY